ncbi:hypothetical protein APSETT444_008330 [Aspergillus pseudonomiae]
MPSSINVLMVYAFCNWHDVSWGTKGSDQAGSLPSAQTKKADAKTNFVEELDKPQADIDTQFEFTVRRALSPWQPPEEKEDGNLDDSYKRFRTNLVLLWVLSNALLALCINNEGIRNLCLTTSSTDRTAWYFKIILWLTSALSVFRFMGALWFLGKTGSQMRNVLGPRHILGAETRSRALCPNFEVVHVISADRRKPSINQKGNAAHHRYDLKLSPVLNISQRLFAEYSASHGKPPLSKRPIHADILNLHTPDGDSLPEDEVWSIVCRWQGLRLLYDLYCNPSIRSRYSRSVFLNWPNNECYEEEHALVHDEPLLEPTITPHKDTVPGGCAALPSLRNRGYRRFYQALTAHWFAVEALWLARISRYKTPQERNNRFVQVRGIWRDNPDRTLQEKLDILEVFDFVWGFLGRKIFVDVYGMRSWLDEDGAGLYFDGEQSEGVNWAFFVRSVTQYLRPPNIIELLLSLVWNPSPSWTVHRPSYLRTLGFFDEQQGICEQPGTRESPDWRWLFPGAFLEYDVLASVIHQITYEDGDEALRALWEYIWWVYRRNYWESDSKGVIIFRDETSSQILWRMRTMIVPHLRHSW